MAKANKLIPVVDGTAGTPIELTDSRIEITNPAANDLLQYDSTQQQFVNTPVNSIVPSHRTINHEQLTDSSLGDINIHDGFYFPNAVQDYDGNWYGAVVIGDQVWLGENLRTTHYADGTAIPNGKIDDEHVTGSDSVAYYTFSDRCTVQIPLEKAGLVYNKTAVMNGESSSNANPSGVQGVAPDGWHIPSKNEFEQLHDYINSQKRYRYNDINDFIAKSLASTQYWPSNNTDGSMGKNPEKNNLSGFNAVPNRIIVLPSANQWVQITSPSFDCATSTVKTMSGSTFQTTYRLTSFQMGQTGNIWYTLASSSDYFGGYHIVRCVSNLNPIQFRDWYINQYGSLQHHLPQEIPAQVQSDWNATSGMGEILNKPTLAAVATSGSYSDLLNRPSVYDSIISFTSNDSAIDSFTVNASQNKTIDIPDKTAWILKHDPDVLFMAVDINRFERYSGICGFTSDSSITTLIDENRGIVASEGWVFNPFKGFVYVKGGFEPLHKNYVSGKYTYRQVCFTGEHFARFQEGPVFLITPMFYGTDISIDDCEITNAMSPNVNRLSVFLGWLMDSKKGAFELWPEHPIYYYDGAHFRLYSGAKDFNGDYTTLSHIPVLNTTNTTALTATSAENITGTVNLHKIAKTGTYSDLIGTPTITDEKVKQTVDATTTEYPLLVSAQSSPTSGTAYEAKYSASLKATGEGDVVFVKNSKKCKLQYNSTDLCLNFVFE